MAQTTYTAAASASEQHRARSANRSNSDRQRVVSQQSSSSDGGSSRQIFQVNQHVYVQYRTHIWIPGTVVQGSAFSVLFQRPIVVVDYYEADGSLARARFVEEDVRAAH
ncbi:hypothetical protein GY45DRAFT_1321688 [Cubamyces sp. BRFM 1775]|nr:hypothetical protein GY45DRAFT_1321688 [Cubamyces sp. BRFM 1775]